MFDDTFDFSEELRVKILRLMYVIHEQGIHDVHMGGLLRILGMPGKQAKKWDDRVLSVDENFAKYIEEFQMLRDAPVQTIH
jgi:hypothetical protein|tara:strand:+ start:150 stop:392 length:243 start_codon:yes stop_codon:yes gene_type:complete